MAAAGNIAVFLLLVASVQASAGDPGRPPPNGLAEGSEAVRSRGPNDDDVDERVREAAEAFFSERFPGYASRLRVRVLRSDAAPDGPAALRIRLGASEGVPRGHTQVRIVRHTEAGPVDAGWAMLYVSHFDSIAIARRDVPAGESVEAADLGAAWMDVTTFRGQPLDVAVLDHLRAGTRYHAARPLHAGDALRTGDLRPPYLAETGQTVHMTYRRGPIVMTIICRAREPGVVGDVIRVYSDATQTTYKARVTGDGTVDWIATR